MSSSIAKCQCVAVGPKLEYVPTWKLTCEWTTNCSNKPIVIRNDKGQLALACSEHLVEAQKEGWIIN